MTEGPFKPDDVILNASAPLTACFGKHERECAAATLVRACQILENRWQPVAARDIGQLMRLEVEAKRDPVVSWSTNPFFQPDYQGLAQAGYATITKSDRGDVLELTEAGIKKLKHWVRSLS